MMPTFLIIGAARSGTTSLYRYLKQHPQVYLSPIKETEFFAFEGDKTPLIGPGFNLRAPAITDLVDYISLFEDVQNEIAIGEASPVYLYSPKAVRRVFHYLPHVKIIAILRNPVDRAYSQFVQNVRDEIEPLTTFEEAIAAEEPRIKKGWYWGYHYIAAGFYFHQLQRYFSRFTRNQIKTYLYEDLKRAPIVLLDDAFTYLGVDNRFEPDLSKRYNVSGFPRSRLIHRFLTKSGWAKDTLKSLLPEHIAKQVKNAITDHNLEKRQIKEETRYRLVSIYNQDILKLEKLIDRDLSAWLK